MVFGEKFSPQPLCRERAFYRPARDCQQEFVIILNCFLGWLFFNEAPIDQLFPGVLGIVLAGMIIIWRDKKKKKVLRVSKKIY